MLCPRCLMDHRRVEMTRLSETRVENIITEQRHYCPHCRHTITTQPALGELRRLILRTTVCR